MSYYTGSDDEEWDYCPGCDTGIDTGHTYDCNCQFWCHPEPIVDNQGLHIGWDPNTTWENAPILQSVISLWYYRSLEHTIKS